MLNEQALMQVITCVPALESNRCHLSSSLTTTIISWTMQTAGSYRNMTVGHWYNCILTHSHVLLSFVHMVHIPLASTGLQVVSVLYTVTAVWEWHQQSEIFPHKHDTFVWFRFYLTLMDLNVIVSGLNHITLMLLSVTLYNLRSKLKMYIENLSHSDSVDMISVLAYYSDMYLLQPVKERASTAQQ